MWCIPILTGQNNIKFACKRTGCISSVQYDWILDLIGTCNSCTLITPFNLESNTLVSQRAGKRSTKGVRECLGFEFWRRQPFGSTTYLVLERKKKGQVLSSEILIYWSELFIFSAARRDCLWSIRWSPEWKYKCRTDDWLHQLFKKKERKFEKF